MTTSIRPPAETLMSICVVIPTIRRKNGFKYLKQSLRLNTKILTNHKIVSDRFLFFSQEDQNELENLTTRHCLRPIYRPQHPQLNKNDVDEYQYWRMHLCLDFAFSMNYALSQSPSSHYMWLEDDTILSGNILRQLQILFHRRPDFDAVSPYHNSKYNFYGFACVLFKKSALYELIDLIYEKYSQDIPLDFFPKYTSYTVEAFPKKCAFHCGKHSSRTDKTIFRINEKLKWFWAGLRH